MEGEGEREVEFSGGWPHVERGVCSCVVGRASWVGTEGGGAFYSRFTRRLLARYVPFTLVYAPCTLPVCSVYAACALRVRFCLHQGLFCLHQGSFGLHQGYLRFTSGLSAV